MVAGNEESILMASPNGVTLLGASRRLRVTYDTITYTVETPDGETVSLAGYKRGAGCPISVEIEVEGAWAEWSEDTPTDTDRTALTPHRYLAKTMRAERMLRRNLLLAAVPGLDHAAADVLSNDGGAWEPILIELGWWTTTTEASTEGEAVAADPSPSTGSAASPDFSPPSTASRSRTSK
jgi:hypothetical protein